ncbi:MAG: carboxymuconolactone decarboxylase family protein [Acidobacteriia bacterium]|nr:carboxymuconolactone decarboxylase family protein [Terriglobia bacterium]
MGVVNPLTKEQAAPEVHGAFDKLSARSGKVPNIFAAMAHRPAVLNTFLPLYAAIVNQGTVDAKYKELAYLRASMVNGCEYCTRAHIASSKRAGVTAEQVAALAFYQRSPLFDEKEKATILYADRVTRGAAGIRSQELQELSKYYDEGQIVELTMVVCMANFTNRFNDALENIPDLGV